MSAGATSWSRSAARAGTVSNVRSETRATLSGTTSAATIGNAAENSGNTTINAPDCTIAANSEADDAISFSGNADITFEAQTHRNATLRSAEAFGILLIAYFVLTRAVAFTFRHLERRSRAQFGLHDGARP